MKNDHTYIQQTLAGDRNAFAKLVGMYQSFVFTICKKVLRTNVNAEEAAQDTFLKVYRSLSTFKQDSKFSTWLYAIAYRTSLDYARKKKIPLHSIDKENSYLQIEDKEVTPLKRAENRSTKEALTKVIRTLKPLDANIILLYYQGEKTVKEIAKILNISESNVKIKLFRLRETLKKKLSLYLRDEVKDLL